MKKRGNASKRAMAELLSNSTDELNISDNNGAEKNDNRTRLAHSFFNEDGGSAAETDGAALAVNTVGDGCDLVSHDEVKSVKEAHSGADGNEVKPDRGGHEVAAVGRVKPVGDGRTSLSSSSASHAVPDHSKGDRAAVASAEAAARVTVTKAQTDTVPKAAPAMKAQTGTIPKVTSVMKAQTGTIPKAVPAMKAQTGTFSKIGEAVTRTFNKVPSTRQNEGDNSLTRTMRAVSPAEEKKSSKKPLKWPRIVLCTAICTVALAASVVFAVYLLSRNIEPLPADICAGLSDGGESSDSSLSPKALDSAPVIQPGEGRFDVTFTFYEEPDVICVTPSVTVGDLMSTLGITAGENTRMYVSPEDVISEDSTVAIDTVSHDIVETTEAIAYDTEYEDVRTVPKGKTSVKRNGQNGVKTFTYERTLVNGVEESRALISEQVTTAPTTRILYRGIGGTVTSQGKTYNYSYYIDVKATRYNIVGNTATGLPTSESVMAVDPRVIPLGTKCVVKGSADYGYRIAADTGGAIKGNKIDLWIPDSSPLVSGGFGWRNARVYILE